MSSPHVSELCRRFLCLDDFEPAARNMLPRPLFAYISGAAEDNLTFAENRCAIRSYGLIPRVLRNVSQRSTTIELLGKTHAAPFGIAPMGLAALMRYDGDVALARAAQLANVPMVLSGTSLTRLERVAELAPNTWFQAYLPGEPQRILALLERVQRAGIEVVVLTVDVCVAANRENLIRSGFSTPLRVSPRLVWQGVTHPRWLTGTLLRTLAERGMPHFENSFATRGAPLISNSVERDFGARDHLNWEHVGLVRKHWPGKLIIKGLLLGEDARLAREQGIDAVVVSNHGGRQLDGVIGSLRALPGVVAGAGDMPVMIDGGFRRGSDIIKALALGARMVFLGRPMLYAATVAGEPGVTHALSLLKAEVNRNMALLGVEKIQEIGAEHVRPIATHTA
jgi:L-lactate dehydrogenase (cytochrome)